MRIITEEVCSHCHHPVRVSLNTVPVPRAAFMFICPSCHERTTAHFTAYIPDERAVDAVVGRLMV